MSSNTRRDKIIKQNEVFLMNDLNDQYIAILSELSGEQDPSATSTAKALETKTLGKIQIQKGKTGRGSLVHSNNTTVEERKIN